MEPARIIDDYFFVIFSLFGVVTSWIMLFSMFSTFHIPQLASGICPFLVCWRSPEDKNLLEEESVRHFELLTNDHGWPPRSFHGMLKWSVWKCLNLQERHRERELSLITSVESWVIEEHHMHAYEYASSKTNVRWFDVPKPWNMTCNSETLSFFSGHIGIRIPWFHKQRRRSEATLAFQHLMDSRWGTLFMDPSAVNLLVEPRMCQTVFASDLSDLSFGVKTIVTQ